MASCKRGSLAPAKAEAEENEGGGWRRMSWDMTVGSIQFCRQLAEAEVRGSEGGPQQGEACVVADGPASRSPCG